MNKKYKLLLLGALILVLLFGCWKYMGSNSDSTGDEKGTQEEAEDDSEIADDKNSEQPLEYRYVECKDEIDKDAYEAFLKDSEKAINELHQEMDACDKEYTGEDIEVGYEDSFAHKNFDSYKLVGVAVSKIDHENWKNSVDFIYELHFSCHGDVTTYCDISYHNVYTNIKDIGIAYPVCVTYDLDGYRYFGEATIDDLLVVLTDGWKVDGDIVIEEP